MPEFVPGLELGELFFDEVIHPLLDEHFPGLRYDAALIGPGSEVIGFDIPQSMDHHWLPYLRLFLNLIDYACLKKNIESTLAHYLPTTWRGYSTHWVRAEGEPVTLVQAFVDEGPVDHRVYVHHLPDWVQALTGIDAEQAAHPPTLLDWLLIPEQILLSLTAGRIYYNRLGQVRAFQEKLAYYPDAVWRYLLHAQWMRIGQEEPFVGRAGLAEDETGAALITARLVGDLMRLGFLIERRYAPYSKHFGAAFARLDCAVDLLPPLTAALQARTWRKRSEHLCSACEISAQKFNDLGLIPPVPTGATSFHDRPFSVIHGEGIARALWESIDDPAVQRLPFGVGKVDQFVDSTDVLAEPARFRALANLYDDGGLADPRDSA